MTDNKALFYQLIVPGPLGKNDPAKPGNDKPISYALERYSKNIYFYWYQFFRAYWDFHAKAEGADAALIRRVKRDFKDALTDDFETWWFGTGRWLFANKYDDESHAISIRNARELRRFKDGMLVFLPYDGHFPDMVKEIRPSFESSVEDYHLRKPRMKSKYHLISTKYELSAIRNQLTVYRAVMSDLGTKGSERATPYRRIFSKIDCSLILDAAQEEWGAAESTQFMHNNFRRACRLIYHVARGEFPNTDEPGTSYLPRRNGRGDEHYLREAKKAEQD